VSVSQASCRHSQGYWVAGTDRVGARGSSEIILRRSGLFCASHHSFADEHVCRVDGQSGLWKSDKDDERNEGRGSKTRQLTGWCGERKHEARRHGRHHTGLLISHFTPHLADSLLSLRAVTERPVPHIAPHKPWPHDACDSPSGRVRTPRLTCPKLVLIHILDQPSSAGFQGGPVSTVNESRRTKKPSSVLCGSPRLLGCTPSARHRDTGVANPHPPSNKRHLIIVVSAIG
jgi:hypothetical protein